MGEAVEGWWHRNDVQGARALVLSSLAFSLMTVCVKHLGGRIPVTEIVMARSLVSIMLTGVGLRMAGVNPWGNKRGLLLARGLAGSLALLCFFQAVTSLPLASATVLQYTYPTFTAGAAWILLAEPLRRRIGLAVAVGWIGVVLVIQPQWIGNGMASLALIPVLLGLAGALCTALAYVCVRRLSVTEHPLVIIFYFPLVSIPISLPGVIQQGVVPSGLDWLWLLAVGVLLPPPRLANWPLAPPSSTAFRHVFITVHRFRLPLPPAASTPSRSTCSRYVLAIGAMNSRKKLPASCMFAYLASSNVCSATITTRRNSFAF